MANGEFPDVFGTEVDLIRPNDRAVTDKSLFEEFRVVKALPIGFVEIARAINDAFLPVVEFDIEPVAIQRLNRNYIVNHFHVSEAVQS